MKKFLFFLVCLGVFSIGSAVSSGYLNVHQTRVESGISVLSTTVTLNSPTMAFSCYASGGDVTFYLYSYNRSSATYSLLDTLIISDGTSMSFDQGPYIKRVVIEKASSVPLAIFTALQ